jgi:flavin-dependent dehydrogenase
MPDSARGGATASQRTIASIGGGPAGSATALVAAQTLARTRGPDWQRHVRIEIFDRAPKGDDRVGESIPPAATPLLRRLGLDHLVAEGGPHLQCPGSISVWNSSVPGHNDFMLDVVGRGYHLDRRLFDAQLPDAAVAAGATVHEGCRLPGVAADVGKNHLSFADSEGRAFDTAADFTVYATGGPAALARRIGVARNTLDEVLFYGAFFNLPGGAATLRHTLVEAVQDGWWYAARLPNDRLIVTFCSDGEAAAASGCTTPDGWLQALRSTLWLQGQLPEAITGAAPSALFTRAAPSTLLSRVCGDSWLAVGDAASRFDPISAAGITKALMQAELAGDAAARALLTGSTEPLQAYQQQVFDDFSGYARVRRMLYGSETRFPGAGFWRRRMGLD